MHLWEGRNGSGAVDANGRADAVRGERVRAAVVCRR